MATTYRINEWNRYFIKADCMKRGKPPWISLTTDHSSYGFRTLGSMPDGAAIYAAFLLICTVVARTDTTEGRLIHDAKPLTAHHLAVRTGFPKSIFNKALPALVDIGWLVSIDCPDTGLTASGQCLANEDGNEDVTETETETISSSDDRIEEIYQAYPRKKSKGAARKAIKAALKKIPFDELLPKVQAYAESVAGKKGTDDWQFVPYPATWFNGERWADEPEPKPINTRNDNDQQRFANRKPDVIA